jgi:predicted aspartyl protease
MILNEVQSLRGDKMKKSLMRLFLIMFMGLFTFHVSAETVKAAKDAVIPFELLDYIIIVKCRINDSKESYNFILDTGALTVIDKTLADELKLKQLGPQAKINTLYLGKHEIGKVFVFTNFDLEPIRASYGIDVRGIIGSDLLEDYIVTIDYEKQRLILSTDMESPALEKKSNKVGYLLKFTRHPINHAPMIKCKLNGNIEVEAMIDTGQPYPLALPLKELERTGALKQQNTLKAKGVIVKWPGTVSPDNFLARLTFFEADRLKINNLMTVFAELPAMLSVPLLGGDFLSRYLTKIDYLHGEILLIPKSGYHGLNHSFSAGLGLKENGERQLVARGIWEKSPADLAGIRIDDRVLEFNSRKVTPELHRELWLLLNDNKRKSVELLIETKDGPRKILLKKRNII